MKVTSKKKYVIELTKEEVGQYINTIQMDKFRVRYFEANPNSIFMKIFRELDRERNA